MLSGESKSISVEAVLIIYILKYNFSFLLDDYGLELPMLVEFIFYKPVIRDAS